MAALTISARVHTTTSVSSSGKRSVPEKMASASFRAPSTTSQRAHLGRAVVPRGLVVSNQPSKEVEKKYEPTPGSEEDECDRSEMYEAAFGGKDFPEFQSAKFLRMQQLAPGVRKVVLEIETSRDRVLVTRAYVKVGQKAVVRLEGGDARRVVTCSPPEDPDSPENWKILLKLRGDLYAGATKDTSDPMSLMKELELHVNEEEMPEIYNLAADSTIEVGAFEGGGMKIKLLHGMFRYRTILVFAAGPIALATARSLFNAKDKKGLQMSTRESSRFYAWAESDELLLHTQDAPTWEASGKTKTFKATGGDAASELEQLFDDDDSLEYDPELTGVLVLADDPEDEIAIKDFIMNEGEVPEAAIVLGSVEEPITEWLRSTPPWVSIKDLVGEGEYVM